MKFMFFSVFQQNHNHVAISLTGKTSSSFPVLLHSFHDSTVRKYKDEFHSFSCISVKFAQCE